MLVIHLYDGSSYTDDVNTRASFILIVLIGLVFSQFSAAVHSVAHVAPDATPGLHILTPDVHHHGHHGENDAQHAVTAFNASPMAKPSESTADCLFYHVILATSAALFTEPCVVVSRKSSAVQAQWVSEAYALFSIENPSIRDPPSIS